MSLFRSEVLENQKARALGATTVHQPVSFIIYTVALGAATLAAAIFLATGVFARKVTVVGWIIPTGGTVQVHALKGGVVKTIGVRQGQVVRAGDLLAAFDLDSSGAEGGMEVRTRAELNTRLREADVQLAQSSLGRELEIRRLRQRALALRSEAGQIAAQGVLQRGQRQIVERQVERAQSLQTRGYLSLTELDQRRQALLAQDQMIADAKRQADSKSAEADDLELQVKTLAAQAASEASQLRSAKAALSQSLTDLDVQTSEVVRAPVGGRIAYVNLRPGETAGPTRPLFAISPDTDEVQAELLVPTNAAAFVAQGQSVRLMVDALPFEHFGALTGQVIEIGRAPLVPGEIAAPLEQKEAAYRVIVRLSREATKAYVGKYRLSSGMTLTADVITERRTFFQWLFEPLVAARARVAG